MLPLNACKPLSEMYQESLAFSCFVDARVETQSCVRSRQTLYHWAAPSGPSSWIVLLSERIYNKLLAFNPIQVQPRVQQYLLAPGS